MRFVQFTLKSNGSQHLGVQASMDGDIINLSLGDTSIPNNLVQFLAIGDAAMTKAKKLVQGEKPIVSLKDVNLMSPLTNPEKIICIGLNYKKHCEESKCPLPTEPMIFSKFSSNIIGPYDNIELPTVSKDIDWEVELAVVIGKKAKCIKQEDANDYIFGYTLAQDISARDWQFKRNHGQMQLGKSMDTFCPLGPAVVTKDKIDPNNLRIKCSVNGVPKQDSNTSDLLFKIDYLIAYMSQLVTLQPGDIMLTGTPSGVGMQRTPSEYLVKGDVLESELENVGKIVNKVV